jgi:hypothetical protein
MKKLVSGLLLSGALAVVSSGAHAAPIAANASPISIDTPLGAVNISGQLSGLAFYQNNAVHAYPGDSETYFDVDNATVTVSKTTGMFQFYVQGGDYSFPTVGVPYDKSSDQNSFFGAVPIAYGKIQFNDAFSISAGKLPTLVGTELGFTPQNLNIERGLLWYQEPLYSRGVQVNYASGPLSIAVSWNDGAYTNVWSSFSGLISYAIDSENTVAFDASVTPDMTNHLYEDRRPGQQIYDLMYTYASGPWTINPYIQYQNYNDHPSYYPVFGGKRSSGSDWGFAVLAGYQFTPEWSLNGRVEYETASGGSPDFYPLVYGPGSNAWSFTITPTYQKGIFFARGELSYASLGSFETGYGSDEDKSDQFRAMVETGIVF